MERQSFFVPYSQHTSRRLRIYDVLLNQDEDQEEMQMERYVSGGGGDRGQFRGECLSSRRIISRWFRRRNDNKLDEKSKDGAVVRDQETHQTAAAAHTVVPGSSNKDKAVNLGVACGLLCHTAASKNGLGKTKDLQVEIEGKELARETTEVVVGSPNSCMTDAEETLNCSCRRTLSVVAEDKSIAGDWRSDSGKSRKDCILEMEELEAELEAELERLLVHLDSDSPTKDGRQQHAAKVQTEDSAPAASGSMTTGEVMSHDLEGPELWGGVSPFELERKLHELLHSRQQERIKELETALECYKHELREKGKEISWWRNTAMLLLRHSK